jgi:hypothetical protein
LYDKEHGEWLWTARKTDTEERLVFLSHKELFEKYLQSPQHHAMSLSSFSMIMKGHYRKAKVHTDCCSICQSKVACACADEALARRVHIRLAYLQQNAYKQLAEKAKY